MRTTKVSSRTCGKQNDMAVSVAQQLQRKGKTSVWISIKSSNRMNQFKQLVDERLPDGEEIHCEPSFVKTRIKPIFGDEASGEPIIVGWEGGETIHTGYDLTMKR